MKHQRPEWSDADYEIIKAAAALAGQTIKAYVERSVLECAQGDTSTDQGKAFLRLRAEQAKLTPPKK